MSKPVLWIDITELFGEYAVAGHPTGISRVIINLADELAAAPGDVFGSVRLVFWEPVRRRLLTVQPGRLAEFLPDLRQRYREAGIARPPLRSGVQKALTTTFLPRRLRFLLFPHLHSSRQFLRWAHGAGLRIEPVRLARGDCLFVPGSFWLGGYAPAVAAQARRAGAAVTAFVHDVLLLSNPEWMPGGHADQFRRGAQAFLPQCAAIVCNSAHTRSELVQRVALPATTAIEICRLGDRLAAAPGALPADIAGPTAGRYALYVSSIIPRKNHRLLAEAWTILLRELGEKTPALVFAGGGHPDPALSDALARAGSTGARIIRVSGLDDGALAALYRDAWLTLYPSRGEGYGLPVAEALGLGKICLAAPSGGIAEIAPHLIDAMDPDDPAALAARIADYFRHPEQRAAREAEIRAAFRPYSWTDTAAQVRRALERAAR